MRQSFETEKWTRFDLSRGPGRAHHYGRTLV